MKNNKRKNKRAYYSFDEWLNIFKDYCKTTGKDLSEIRRIDIITYQNEEVNIGLKIHNLRISYKNNKLSQDEIIQLEELGMAWDLKSFTSVDKWIVVFEDYCKNTGNTLADIKGTETHIYNNQEYRVGERIVNYLRPRYKENKLTQEHISQLEKLGMIWISKSSTSVDKWIVVFEDYCNTTGKDLSSIKVSDTYIYKDQDYKLGKKISNLRTDYKNNKLSQDEINQLEELGMIWHGASEPKKTS